MPQFNPRTRAKNGEMLDHALEGKFGHIPLMIFSQMYELHKHKFKAPFLVIKGRVSRRQGTQNIVVTRVKPFNALNKVPPAKNRG